MRTTDDSTVTPVTLTAKAGPVTLEEEGIEDRTKEVTLTLGEGPGNDPPEEPNLKDSEEWAGKTQELTSEYGSQDKEPIAFK